MQQQCRITPREAARPVLESAVVLQKEHLVTGFKNGTIYAAACFYGLRDMVSFDEITTTLRSAIDPKQSTERLLDAALHNGGRDNITIIAVHLSAPAPDGDY